MCCKSIATFASFHDGRIEKQTFPNYENLIIEDVIKYDLELTESALKQIGLNP